MTFEAWLTKDKYYAEVIQPFKDYLKVAFREHCYLRIRYPYLLSTANDSVAVKSMQHAQDASNAESDIVPPLSSEGSVSAHLGGAHQSSSPSANEVGVENHTGTAAIEVKERLDFSLLNDLKSSKRRSFDPGDDDDAEYIAGNEDDIEFGAPGTTRTKSTRISKQSKRAKLTHEAM